MHKVINKLQITQAISKYWIMKCFLVIQNSSSVKICADVVTAGLVKILYKNLRICQIDL